MTWLILEGMQATAQKEMQQFNEILGEYSSMSADELEQKKSDDKKKIEAYKTIPFKSEVTPLIVKLVSLMPNGMWLNAITVESKDAPQDPSRSNSENKYYKLKTMSSITVNGYVFKNDSYAEFELVNDFVAALAGDKTIAKYVKEVKLKTLQVQTKDKKKVTNFSLECF